MPQRKSTPHLQNAPRANRSSATDHALLARLRAACEALPEVQLAVVFGSLARDEAVVGSDADLGLRLDPDTRQLRREVEVTLGRKARREVDFVYLDEAHPLLRFEVARDGAVLLERRPHAWTDFKTRAMVDWWDWAPTARRIHAAAVRRLRERLRHDGAA